MAANYRNGANMHVNGAGQSVSVAMSKVGALAGFTPPLILEQCMLLGW